jgi:hypothetical protein
MPDDGTNVPAIAGAAAFVAGAVGTIAAAIGSFGSDDSALAAARRNHVPELVAATSAAAVGLMIGGLYGILRDAPPGEKPTGTGLGARARRLAWWFRQNNARPVLAVGVIAVALGVALGAYATVSRQPGRPTITITRVDKESVMIEITAEGQPSRIWFDALLRGYPDTASDGVFLASARFSPGQDGKVDWKERVELPATVDTGKAAAGSPITRVLVTVARNKAVPTKACAIDQDVVHGDATCLSIRVPPDAETIPKMTTSTG